MLYSAASKFEIIRPVKSGNLVNSKKGSTMIETHGAQMTSAICARMGPQECEKIHLASLEILHTIKYNNLKNEFVITRGEDKGKSIVVTSLSEAESIMTEVENLKVAKLNRLERNNRYQVRIKAELSKITLPFYLHYVFRLFLFLWDFETDWYATDFIY